MVDAFFRRQRRILNETLTVNSGNATIVADPGTFGDVPIISASGNTSEVSVNTPTANIGSLSLTSGATLNVQSNIVNIGNTTADPVSHDPRLYFRQADHQFQLDDRLRDRLWHGHRGQCHGHGNPRHLEG